LRLVEQRRHTFATGVSSVDSVYPHPLAGSSEGRAEAHQAYLVCEPNSFRIISFTWVIGLGLHSDATASRSGSLASVSVGVDSFFHFDVLQFARERLMQAGQPISAEWRREAVDLPGLFIILLLHILFPT